MEKTALDKDGASQASEQSGPPLPGLKTPQEEKDQECKAEPTNPSSRNHTLSKIKDVSAIGYEGQNSLQYEARSPVQTLTTSSC